jgi:exportin-1
MTSNMDQVAASLINQFDLSTLDNIVTAAYDPANPERSAANKVLMQLQEAPELWTKADEMIEKSNNPQTRFFGLQVLDDAIKTR